MADILYPAHPVLIVDDELSSSLTLEALLNDLGITHTLICKDSREVEKILTTCTVSLILLDLQMPYISGEELIPIIRQKVPEIPIIIFTVNEDVQSAVRCMKKGVYDYFIKNKSAERLQPVLCKALEIAELKMVHKNLERKMLAPAIEHMEAFAGIVTRHQCMLAIFEYLEAVAPSTETVLITGETGTGKELIAKAIHTVSGRKGEFVAVNVAALDDTQFSDTLFGHGPGAFTDAKTPRKGLVELAQGGTLFIDEIADLGLDTQQKLLRLLEEREYRPLGIDHPRISNAKIVTATNKDIKKLIAAGKFRHDLYYRLNTHAIHLPPLRERKEDISILINFFVEEAARENNKKKPAVPEDVHEILLQYDYPGNVRELRALLYDAVIINKTGILSCEYFLNKLAFDNEALQTRVINPKSKHEIVFPEVLPTVKELKDLLYAEALKRVNGNKKIAAQILGVSRQAIIKRSNSELSREKI